MIQFKSKLEPRVIDIKATRLFYRNRDSTARVIINRGGTRASKSYSIQQVLFLERFLTEKNKKFLVLRKTLPSLKLAGLMDFKRFLFDYGLENKIVEEKQALNYYYKPNKNYLHFGSLDKPEKIRSTSWNYIYLQEAIDFTYEDYLEAMRRLSEPSSDGKRNQLFMCLNPTDEYCWIKEKVIDKEKDVEEIHSTYLDNPFISNDYRDYLENLINVDLNHYNIYVKGEWGRLEDLIYRNWVSVNVVPEGEVIYGLDFGFVAPSALVKITIVDVGKGAKAIYEEQLLYQPGLTNSELIEKLKVLIPNKRKRIYADSAEPARIKEICDAGFNISESNKNVIDGIDFVKRQKIFIHENSIDLIKEKRAYSWRKDRSGRVLEEPVKFNDHLLAGERYAIFTHLKGTCNDVKLRFL